MVCLLFRFRKMHLIIWLRFVFFLLFFDSSFKLRASTDFLVESIHLTSTHPRHVFNLLRPAPESSILVLRQTSTLNQSWKESSESRFDYDPISLLIGKGGSRPGLEGAACRSINETSYFFYWIFYVLSTLQILRPSRKFSSTNILCRGVG